MLLLLGNLNPADRFSNIGRCTFEFFHLGMNYLEKAIFAELWNEKGVVEMGTVRGECERISRHTVDPDIMKAYDADKLFIFEYLNAVAVEAIMDYFNMNDVNDAPSRNVPPSFNSLEEQKNWVYEHFGKIVDMYIYPVWSGNTTQQTLDDDIKETFIQMAAKAWKSLARKVLKFNEKFNGSGVICFALINNRFVYEGSQQIKHVFAENDDVQELYKAAILSHPSGNEPAEETIQPTSSSLLDLLKKHVYDMDICMMRFILASAVAPQNSVGAKDGRRHWYQEANSPQWWRDTGIPFQSVNQPSGGNKKMKKVPLMTLVEALQGHHNVVPLPPQKNNKTGYGSRFLVEADGNTEEPGNVSLSGTDTEGNLEDIAFPVAEEPSTLSVPDTEDIAVSVSYQLEHKEGLISSIFEEEISWEEKSLKTMKLFSSWDELLALAPHVRSKLPEIPGKLANRWKPQFLVKGNKRYKDFIPLSIGERQVLESTPNGNCLYNAISIAVYGTEDMAMVLKLASVVGIVEDLLEFSKYIAEEYNCEIWKWINIAIADPTDANTVSDLEGACRHELLETVAHPYRDGSQLHLHMLTHLLGRPIQQHCIKSGLTAVQMKQLLLPPLKTISRPSPIHDVWVPTKPQSKYSSYNHVVPAVCSVGPYGTHVEECAFEGLGMCAFLHGCNSAVNPSWVECTLCGQWVHDVCMNVKASTYSASDSFPCGCDILNEGIVPIQSLGWYKSLKVDNLKIDFKELVNTTDKNVSLRRAIFQREGQASVKLGLRLGRFGPFTETFIDELNEKLLGFVDPDKQSLIPDVYMPEVLLEVMKRKETINRLLAELVLIQWKPMDD